MLLSKQWGKNGKHFFSFPKKQKQKNKKNRTNLQKTVCLGKMML